MLALTARNAVPHTLSWCRSKQRAGEEAELKLVWRRSIWPSVRVLFYNRYLAGYKLRPNNPRSLPIAWFLRCGLRAVHHGVITSSAPL
ncbi:unnamed protein product [Nezara viridula]|uniref:Uncharacterized protein n=1 Tax=Nezara viridula TaxID=85310 RepID=A0A9P0HMD0_NEZVI|nr:unnamed protein product [Nezara viridula]